MSGSSCVVDPVRHDRRPKRPPSARRSCASGSIEGEIDLARAANLPLLGDLRSVLAGSDPRACSKRRERPPAPHRDGAEPERRPKERCYRIIDATAPKRGIDLTIDAALTADWLTALSCATRWSSGAGVHDAVIGLSGGVDSAVTAYPLRAGARAHEHVHVFRMPYRTSSRRKSLGRAGGDRRTRLPRPHDRHLGRGRRLPAIVEPDADGRRKGNVMARTRMLVLFDQSGETAAGCRSARGTRRSGCSAISPGTRTTRRRSTRSAISSRRRCGRSRGISACPRASSTKPRAPISKPNQTDEGDLGISYAKADGDPRADALRLPRTRRSRRADIAAADDRDRARRRSARRIGSGICRRPRWSRTRRSTTSTLRPVDF